MLRAHRLGILLSIVSVAIFFAIAIPSLRSRATGAQQNPQTSPTAEAKGNEAEAFRNNTLGVAYMNQQKFAEAQKYFEKALAADPKFAIAKPLVPLLKRLRASCPTTPTLGTTSASFTRTSANPKRASRRFSMLRSFRLKPTPIIFWATFTRSCSATTMPSPNFRRPLRRFPIMPHRNLASRAPISEKAIWIPRGNTSHVFRKSQRNILALRLERAMAIRAASRSPNWAAAAC